MAQETDWRAAGDMMAALSPTRGLQGKTALCGATGEWARVVVTAAEGAKPYVCPAATTPDGR